VDRSAIQLKTVQNRSSVQHRREEDRTAKNLGRLQLLKIATTASNSLPVQVYLSRKLDSHPQSRLNGVRFLVEIKSLAIPA
jgi:hypothetical protein